ncbi:hypothetical protein EUX98_g1832 [Antrodiella citrinella]|uniref:DUF6593 domain-containing protein n=1 Tax=Antrodiella citrinella TaxID=2447956 RepID=A0A4S4N2Q9_9APHY|nr:hypothetical protein EUX98_g1832 [Antrodiella citrinella]
MELYLSRSDIAHTILSRAADAGDDLDPLYHIDTVTSLSKKTTTVSRILPSVASRPEFNGGKHSDIKKIAKSGQGLVEVAKIEWRQWKSSSIWFEEREWKANEFMPNTGFMSGKRVFTGPDGHSYTWHSDTYLTVSTPDNPKLEIARFHEPALFNWKKRYLNIVLEGLHMVDLIIATWVYVAILEQESNSSSTPMAGAACAGSMGGSVC